MSQFLSFLGSCPNPDSNTGLNSQTTFLPVLFPTETPKVRFVSESTSVHAATYSIHADAVTLLWDECEYDVLENVKSFLNFRFDLTVNRPIRVGVMWDYSFRSPGGSLYQFRHHPDGTKYRLALSGTDCSACTPSLLFHFLKSFRSDVPSLRCTRIDIALDDFQKRLKFDVLRDAIDNRNYSGVRSASYIRNSPGDGFTIYLGRRQSEHYVRIYNKLVESRGAIDSHRYESEFKGLKAQLIMDELVTATTVLDSEKILRKHVLGNINFIHKTDRNLVRCERLDWWQQWLDYLSIEPIAITVVRRKSSVFAKMCWMEKQVKKSLAVVRTALGEIQFGSFVDDLVSRGSEQLRQFDYLLVEEYLIHSA